MSFLTGKAATSKNKAYGFISDTYSPAAEQGVAASGMTGDLLGVGGDPAASQAAFKNYLNSTGYDFMFDQGHRAITGSNAARGLLNSGSTLKALDRYGQGIGGQYFNNYLNQLNALSGLGLQGGGLITQAGQVQKGATQGAAGLIGAGLSLFSDVRLKTAIRRIGTLAEGLGLYRFRYLWDRPETERTGVMAQEVAAVMPEALGPTVGGYMTVRYDRLLEAI